MHPIFINLNYPGDLRNIDDLLRQTPTLAKGICGVAAAFGPWPDVAHPSDAVLARVILSCDLIDVLVLDVSVIPHGGAFADALNEARLSSRDGSIWPRLRRLSVSG